MIVRDKPFANDYQISNQIALDASSAYRTARMTVSRGTIEIDGVKHKAKDNFSLVLQTRISEEK